MSKSVFPECTIVIAHWNAWQYLPKAIACAKAQTVPCEVIVIDDLSPQWRIYLQESPAELWEGVTFVHTPRKLNWGPTLNLGFQYAQTPWVVPLNGDDLIAPNMVEECLNKSNGHHVVFPENAAITHQIYQENYLPYCALIGKNIWQLVGGYNETPLADWDFWCRICKKFAVSAGVSEPLFTWVDRPGSETRRLGASGELERIVAEFKAKWAKR